MFGRLGAPEIILILVVIILPLGATTRPPMARAPGKDARSRKSAAQAPPPDVIEIATKMPSRIAKSMR